MQQSPEVLCPESSTLIVNGPKTIMFLVKGLQVVAKPYLN